MNGGHGAKRILVTVATLALASFCMWLAVGAATAAALSRNEARWAAHAYIQWNAREYRRYFFREAKRRGAKLGPGARVVYTSRAHRCRQLDDSDVFRCEDVLTTYLLTSSNGQPSVTALLGGKFRVRAAADRRGCIHVRGIHFPVKFPPPPTCFGREKRP